MPPHARAIETTVAAVTRSRKPTAMMTATITG